MHQKQKKDYNTCFLSCFLTLKVGNIHIFIEKLPKRNSEIIDINDILRNLIIIDLPAVNFVIKPTHIPSLTLNQMSYII